MNDHTNPGPSTRPGSSRTRNAWALPSAIGVSAGLLGALVGVALVTRDAAPTAAGRVSSSATTAAVTTTSVRTAKATTTPGAAPATRAQAPVLTPTTAARPPAAPVAAPVAPPDATVAAPAADPPPPTAGVTIDGASYRVTFACVQPQQPFETAITQYQVTDASGHARLVLTFESNHWADVLHVTDMSDLVVGTTVLADGGPDRMPAEPLRDVPVALDATRTIRVSANLEAPEQACDMLQVDFADGQSSVYSVADVCRADGIIGDLTPYEFFVFNPTPSPDGAALTMMSYGAESRSGRLVMGGRGYTLVDPTSDMLAKGMGYTGALVADGDSTSSGSYTMFVGQYPEGGHGCMASQVAD